MKRPNAVLDFLVVGAAKSGTTSIDRALRSHPDLCFPEGIKETYYWVRPADVLGNGVGYWEKEFITDGVEYGRRFCRGTDAAKIRGEVCNGYLYFYRETIESVRQTLGDIKIITVLRNPVERAYSGYLHLLRDGVITETFREALAKEEERVAQGYWWAFHLYRIGLYYESVLAYKKNFSNVAVYLFDDFVADRRRFYGDLLAFLGVDTNWTLNSDVHANRTGVPRNPKLWKLLRRDSVVKRMAKRVLPRGLQDRIRRGMEQNIVKPEIEQEVAAQLWEQYLPDVEKLSHLVDRDLVKLWEIV